MSSDPYPSRKRPRQEGPETTRSEIWLDDGNVILQTQQTQFRVHRSILSRHSNIFRDMFAIPQPEGEALIEGCPVVQLSDEAADLEAILSILYDNLSLHVAESIHFLVVVMMMANKYSFDKIRNEALGQLKARFPCTLAAWDQVICPPSHCLPDVVEAINLAYDLSLQTIIPAALATLVKSGTPVLRMIFDGFRRDDDSIVRLCTQGSKALALGMQSLMQAVPDVTMKYMNIFEEQLPGVDCEDFERCASNTAMNVVRIWRNSTDHNALNVWDDYYVLGLCDICVSKAQSFHHSGRRTVWRLLPSYFLLPEWDKLEDFTPVA